MEGAVGALLKKIAHLQGGLKNNLNRCSRTCVVLCCLVMCHVVWLFVLCCAGMLVLCCVTACGQGREAGGGGQEKWGGKCSSKKDNPTLAKDPDETATPSKAHLQSVQVTKLSSY